MYAVLAFFMLKEILHKQTQRTYYSKNYFLYTPIFSKTCSLEKIKFITRYLHSSNNFAGSDYEWPAKHANI
jgi:hypothetical protein